MWGGACILETATPPIPRERSFSAHQFGVVLYLCMYPLTQNDQIWHGNTWGVSVSHPTPLHLHKCVTRFVVAVVVVVVVDL